MRLVFPIAQEKWIIRLASDGTPLIGRRKSPVCARLGLKSPSESYLFRYLKDNEQVPNISLECVMKTAGIIESRERNT